MAKSNVKRRSSRSVRPRAYDLEVCIIQGLVSRSFVKQNPVICRTIRIRGDQTLEHLHDAIFRAFDRFDHHMYEFQVGGKRPMDPAARRYVMPMAAESDPVGRPAGVVTTTTIDSLKLKRDDAFAYWFDFGDDWWHQVTVLGIGDAEPGGRYPRVIASTGASPPQYPEEDEFDDDDDEE